MGRDILSEFGPESYPRPDSRIAGGGNPGQKDVLNYRPPSGPIGIERREVGLGGRNLGKCGTQESRSVFGDGAGGMTSSGQICRVQGRHD